MVALPNTKIDSSMIEEFSTPIFDEHNRDTYMYVDEYGKVIYKDITALIDDINEDGGIIGTNKNSKRVAVIHLIFNISGRLLFPPILLIFGGPFGSILETLVSRKEIQIAIFHFFSM